MEKINEWLVLNKLSLNIKKTKYMVFKHKSSKREINLSLKLNSIEIAQVKSFTFLGLKLNETLTWNDHIEETSNKVSKTIGVMNRLKNVLPTKVLRMIYTSLILPRFYYCNLAWGKKPGRLEQLQKKAIRIANAEKYNAHTEPILKRTKMLKLQDIHICNKLKFFYKLVNNMLPPYFWQYMFTANTSATRSKDPFQMMTPKTAVFTETIRFSLPTLLQHTPPLIKAKAQTHSMDGFINYIKKTMWDKYEALCRRNNCFTCRSTS